ncbi:hypothetical protein Tsubulata_034621 [Turnera subulata]|uniref:Terpene synthase n=1 Tax=Turnera subulata TaxID=218843 RepID=A0A9Q0G0P2_9ROSI|nr:hypothetical protein Tsubulata_034621 [Turnera subulata]
MEKKTHPPTEIKDENRRPLPNFPPSIWGTTFTSFSFPEQEFQFYTGQVQQLKKEVERMLIDSTKDVAKNIEFIDLLCRLGVSYHFENEIEMQLKNIFYALTHQNDYDHDLYTTSLLFRVLRQHGYKVPCSVFHKFKEEVNGEFKRSIINDLKGILSLYEASHVSVPEEDILDEALVFAREILEKSLTSMQLSPQIEKHIKNTLIRPFHKGLPRIEARQCISFYKEEESVNGTLLEFAKLDFNRVQLLHKQELSILSRWWSDSNFTKQLPYVRERIVESYFWANAFLSEPQYELSRFMISKYLAMVTVVDDTYDSYATLEELKHFTDAMERCDIFDAAADQLPADYMKFLYKVLINLFKETACEMTKRGRSYSANSVKEEFKNLVRSYHVEAEWSNNRHVPPFEEYICNGKISSGTMLVLALAFTGMEKVAGIKEYEWLRTNPEIVEAAKLIACLLNDISGHQDEQKRGDCASSVECYMKECQASKDQAIQVIRKMSACAVKDINNVCMTSTAIPKQILKIFANIVRACDVVYDRGNGDAFTNPTKLKDHVISIFIEKIY